MERLAPPSPPLLRGPVQLSHLLLGRFVSEGCRVVDATCGNGHDTLVLARLAGATGRVWAFDIQEAALTATRLKLEEAGLDQRVRLVHAGHEEMAQHVGEAVHAVVFNFGYLPGGDRGIVTSPDTSLRALTAALDLLLSGGIIAAAVYPGHPGGAEEGKAIEKWAAALPATSHAWRMGRLNTSSDAPYSILIQKVA